MNLIRGGTVSGTVTPDADIECDRESNDSDLDGTCTTADLRPGVLVSDAEYDDLVPNTSTRSISSASLSPTSAPGR